jgi:hypothetical protein
MAEVRESSAAPAESRLSRLVGTDRTNYHFNVDVLLSGAQGRQRLATRHPGRYYNLLFRLWYIYPLETVGILFASGIIAGVIVALSRETSHRR